MSAITFQQPNNEDILLYDEDDVLCEIEPPIPVNQTWHSKLSKADLKQTNEIIASRKKTKVRIFAPKGLNKDQQEKLHFCMVL